MFYNKKDYGLALVFIACEYGKMSNIIIALRYVAIIYYAKNLLVQYS